MNRKLAQWALLGATAIALAGCGGPGGREQYVDRHPLPPDTMTVRMQEPGVYGGRFVIGATASPKTFNPHVANERPSNDVCNQLFSSLVDVDYPTQQDLPQLAKSWTWSADRCTLRFALRRGLRFSDGHPLTSADVAFSFSVAADTALGVGLAEGLAITDAVSGERRPFTFSAPDSYSFVVTTSRPYALLLSAIGAVRVLPEHVLGRAWKEGRFASAYGVDTPPESLVTSGPWTLGQFVDGEKVVLHRNPWWHGVDERGHRLPYLDEVVFVLAKDQDAAALRFQAGELDGLDNVRPEDYAAYESTQAKQKFKLYDIGPSFNSAFLWFNLNRAKPGMEGHRAGEPMVGAVKYGWFSHREFRRAVSMAIDRDALIRGPFRGEGVKNWSTMSPGNPRWFDPAIVGPDYDPEGAKRLLASLGWKDVNGDGFLEDEKGHTIEFTMHTNSDANMRKEMLNLVRDDLAKVGVRMNPVPLEFNTLTSHMRGDLVYDAILLGQGSAVPAEPGMGQNTWRSSGLLHYWNIRQEHPATPEEARMDACMDRIVYDTDEPARKAAWRELMGIVNDQCWLVWLPTQKIKLPVRSRFGNVQPSPMPHRILWNIDRVFVRPGAER